MPNLCGTETQYFVFSYSFFDFALLHSSRCKKSCRWCERRYLSAWALTFGQGRFLIPRLQEKPR